MSLPARPEKVNICGVTHKIEYMNTVSDVDIHRREFLFGQYDGWSKTIRIYDGGRPTEDIFQDVLHEILHGIEQQLKMSCFSGEDGHKELDILALMIADVFIRNGWITFEEKALPQFIYLKDQDGHITAFPVEYTK